MENIKEKIINNKLFLITLLICVTLTSSIMLLIYKHNTSSVSIKIDPITDSTIDEEFTPYLQKFYDINLSLKDCVNGLTIDTKNTISILNSNINELSELQNNISSLSIANNEYPDLIPKLVSSIDLTKSLYNYCIDVLSYNTNLNNTEVTSQILLLKEDCIKSYEDLTYYGITFTFPDDSILFFDNLIGYLNTLDKLDKENIVKTSQYNNFISNLNTAIDNFTPLLEDLRPAIEKIREDNRSLDVILEDIASKESKFADVKKAFSYSSIPENCVSYYNSLNSTFKLYSTYLNTLKIAVIYEKSSSGYESNKQDIDKNYSNAYSKLKDVQNSLDTLKNSID